MADIKTVKGAKKGQDKPRRPSIAKDSVASTSTAKLLYGLAEGEVWGLVDGGKSIRLDGTPLLDDNGNANFEGVTWDFRHGTNEQEYIKGFPDVSNETPINVELRSDNPWIKAFTDTQLSAVRVRFKWNRLSKTDPDNGDVKGYKIQYAIDLQTNGGAYVEVLNTKIEDKTSAGYERTHRIDLPQSTTGWQIRVRRITPNDPSEYVQDDMYIDAVAEVIDVKLRYPNTALLGLQYNAETFSSIAKLEAHVRGSIIRVPSNYDADARTYTGIWDGTFKDAYSNNPAWVCFDLCTQWRYGLGERLDITMIDKWSLYALGQYCDQMVSDGQGGLEPRFTCNVYLQKQADAYQVLSNIGGIFRAMSYWNGERIVLDADVPQDPVYTFSRANVIDGNFEYTGTRARDRHTLAKVAWDNPLNRFETEYEYVRDEKAMAKFGVKVLDLSAFGCTSQAQAQRAGLWALKTEQLETRQVSFGVGLDGFIPSVGNIINVSDELFAGRANGGRVSAVSDAQYVVTVDRDIVANAGDVLIVNSGSGQSERRTIKTVAGRKIRLNAPFEFAETENVWAIETADLKLMRFRVMSITKNDEATFAITAIQHEPQKYDAIDFGTDVKPTNITIVNPDVVDAPASVAITSRHRVVQGQTVTTLVIGWSQVKDAVAYDVEWRKDDGTWVKVPRTGNVSVEIEAVYSGNYLARVRSVSAFDVQSQPTTSTLTEVQGKAGLPPTIVGLTATGVLFGMDLKWGFQTGSGDADYTEIQVGSAPNVNVATLGQYSYPTNSHTVTGLQGNLSQSYRARLVDKLGFKSAWSDWVTGTTDASADKVLDLLDGKITESQLYQDLGAKIDKIEQNETAISNETQQRIDDITNLDTAIGNNATAISNEAQQRINDILAANNAINAERDARIDALTALDEGFATEIQQRKDADSSTNSRIDTVVSKTDDNTAAIAAEFTARTNADNALSTRIDTVVSKTGDNTAAITAEQTARTTADTALSSRIDTVSAKTNDNTAAITAEATARTDADSAQVEQINVIKADYKPQYADKTKYADASRSVQWSYWKTVARDNYATNQRITVLQSDVADSNAQITQSLETLATKDTALAASIEQLTTATGQNAAAITAEQTARTTADSSLSSRIDTLSSKTDSNTSAITSESTARTNADAALSTRIDAAVSKADDNTAAIVSEQQTRADADTALTNSITALQSTVSDNTAAISTEATTRADADSSLSTRIDTVQSSTATAQSKADKAESDAAAAQTAATNAATLAGNKGEVIFGSTAPVAAKRLAQNLWIDTNGGKNTPKRWNGSAWVAVTDKAAVDAQAAANTAQSTANDALSKANTATSNIATIQTELTATTSKTNATATSVSTLQTTVADNTASIQTVNQVTDGLSAQSTTVLDVNGHVIGVGTYNDGKTGTFAVRADEFYIASPSGDTTSTFVHYPSSVTINGTTIAAGTYLRGDVIATGSITGDKIRANTSITAPTINGGEININDNFIVDNAGNLLAKSGTFEGTVLANKISGTIDIATMKRSAWTAGYKLFIIKDFTAPRSTPSDFNSARQYSSLIPSYGGISWSAGSGGNTNEIAGAMFEIEIDVAEDTTVTQKAFVIDNLLHLYVNDDYIGLYNNAYPDSSSGGLISYNLVKGINKIQCILNNSGAECSLSLLGDFIDNQNVKFA